MRGIFRWFGGRRRATGPVEADVRETRMAAFDGLMAAAVDEKRKRWVGMGVGLILVFFGVGYAVIGVVSGANADWDLSVWVHNGKSGGPLLYVYIMSGLVAVLLTAAGVHALVTGRRAAMAARDRTAELVSQHAKDLAAQHPDAPRA